MSFYPILKRDTFARVLYEFEGEFDKDKAINDLQYGGKAKLDLNKLLYFYDIFFTIVSDILDTVYTPYLLHNKKLVYPFDEVKTDYLFFVNLVEQIQLNWRFILIKKINLRGFERIDGDQERILQLWKERKGQFIDYEAYIKEALLRQKIKEYPIPFRVERYKQAVYRNLQQQKVAQTSSKHVDGITKLPDDFGWSEDNPYEYIFGDRGSYVFQEKKGSKRKKANITYIMFSMIVKPRGNYEWIERIANMAGSDAKTIRTLKDQLNKKLKQYRVRIDLNGDGMAKMTVLP